MAKRNPVAHPRAVHILGSARFTVLADGIMARTAIHERKAALSRPPRSPAYFSRWMGDA